MKNLLFPHVFKLIGWIMFVPSLILGGYSFFTNEIFFTGIGEIIMNDIVIIGTTLGALFIICSRERIEDEMTRSIRLSSLLNSIYAYVILLVVCTILINGIEFLIFALVNLVLLPILFVCNFRLEMYRFKKLCEDEEQN